MLFILFSKNVNVVRSLFNKGRETTDRNGRRGQGSGPNSVNPFQLTETNGQEDCHVHNRKLSIIWKTYIPSPTERPTWEILTLFLILNLLLLGTTMLNLGCRKSRPSLGRQEQDQHQDQMKSHTWSTRTIRNCCRGYGNTRKCYGEKDIYQIVDLGQTVASYRN